MKLSKEELEQRQYDDKRREQRITLMRANIVRKQILEAYEILERIKLDHVSDTAFREKIVGAKRELEKALNDFLMDESYHRKNIKRINDLSPAEYEESMQVEGSAPTQSNKVG